MSNIFSKEEIGAIVKRIEETYNVSGKKVKLTIEIIDDNKEINPEPSKTESSREKEVRKVVEDLFDKFKISSTESSELVSDSLPSGYGKGSRSDVSGDLSMIRRRRFDYCRITLLDILVSKYTYYEYKAQIKYVSDNKNYDLYVVIGKDNMITKISEIEF